MPAVSFGTDHFFASATARERMEALDLTAEYRIKQAIETLEALGRGGVEDSGLLRREAVEDKVGADELRADAAELGAQ